MATHALPLWTLIALLPLGCTEPVGQLETISDTASDATNPLSAVATTGSVYRINGAQFVIVDPSGHREATAVPTTDGTLLDVTLKPGNYSVSLTPGWVLQRQIDNGWVDMTATPTGAPPEKFMIRPNETTVLKFSFSAGFNTGSAAGATPPSIVQGKLNGATGKARILIDVDDCPLYVSKITALASYTIDCRGTLDASQYSYSSSAGLVRNFTSCRAGSEAALDSIDGVLSLQFERPTLEDEFPQAKRDIKINQAYSAQCIARAFDKWKKSFAASGVNVCPTWERLSTTNDPLTGADAVVTAGLPACTSACEGQCSTVPVTAPSLVQLEKIAQVYKVSFPEGGPTPNCGTATQCAIACAGGYTGFVMSTDGDTISTDPAYWELGNIYDKATNPFLKQGYYHAMADYGPVPGDQFGHYQRAKAYQQAGKDVGEACTYYLSGTRFWTTLIYNKNTTGAVSWCRPPG